MEKNVALFMGDNPVRFTPGGDVFVVDAIGALSNSEEAAVLWEELKQKKPDLLSYVTQFKTDGARQVPVADIDGWEKIQDGLFDMIFFRDDK